MFSNLLKKIYFLASKSKNEPKPNSNLNKKNGVFLIFYGTQNCKGKLIKLNKITK